MNGNEKTPLTVYKASAGSGKTFRLAVEYIKLLVQNPDSYRHILAVTFTNKATEEMKKRILSQLYGIAKGLPASDSYMQEIKKTVALDDNMLRKRAGDALKNLLHDYSYFHVETIDSFFQTVLKNLARELDLTPNLKIDLNDAKVKNDAVDLLIRELDNDEQTLRQIMKFVEENIENDKGWNVIGKIKDFGNIVFKDFYKEKSEEIGRSIANVPELKAKLHGLIDSFEQQMQQFATEFDNLYGNTEIPGKNNIRNYFKNIQNGKFLSKDLSQNYVQKTLDDENAVAHDLTVRCEKYRQKYIRDYVSACAVLPYLNQITLLQKIEAKIRILNNDANRFLLSDTQNILFKIISGSDAPFIYEKIGTRINHVMIDEFQDTSVIQWKNFKVLLDDCMARAGMMSLIVGDVKQSIYRWRSGDWRLLHNIQSQYDKNSVQIQSLNTNYRSEQNIVTFNNAFFQNAIMTASESIRQAYADIQQTADRQDGKGFVRISFIGNEDKSNEETQLQAIFDTITELKARGADEKNITLLLRKNDKIALIAHWFAENHPEIKIISDEAFKLSSSASVSILIHACTYLLQKDDISLAYLQKHRKDKVEIFLQQQERLLSLPLYDMAERLFSIFELHTMQDESAFLCAFFDYLLDFVRNNPADIRLFLREWENSICEKTIQAGEVNGIRIMTIHKSKGLEFDHVIIPFCDWKTGINWNDLLWVSTEGKELVSELPIVPVRCVSALKDSIFSKEYEEEVMQNTVDNLNMLYVAFTRASKNLFIICKKKFTSYEISSVINQAVQGIDFLKTTENGYEFGEITCSTDIQNGDDGNIFTRKSEVMNIDIRDSEFVPEFRESNKSNYFSAADSDDSINHADDTMRQRGILLHNLLSEIEHLDDAENVIGRYETEGMFGELVSRQDAENVIRKITANKQLNDWFSSRWYVLNEREIVKKNDAEGSCAVRHRCDRVIYNDKETIVIDFKFGTPEKRYVRQVREYITLLQQVGFKNVKGYLWYANTDTVEVVE